MNFQIKKNSHLLLIATALLAAPSVKAQSKLDDYIREGLTSSQSIKQQNFVLEKSVYALKEAKSMFGPDVTFSTTYTKANGGRTIDFPTGDLFNGVYSTLNK
ncbi:MAG: TolC family protein, partial [Mucilaginibacter sp.]